MMIKAIKDIFIGYSDQDLESAKWKVLKKCLNKDSSVRLNKKELRALTRNPRPLYAKEEVKDDE